MTSDRHTYLRGVGGQCVVCGHIEPFEGMCADCGENGHRAIHCQRTKETSCVWHSGCAAPIQCAAAGHCLSIPRDLADTQTEVRPSNPITLPRVTAMGRQLEATEPDYMAYYTSYEVARDALVSKDREIEQLQMRLKRHEPTSLYNGRDIDSWKIEAERSREALKAVYKLAGGHATECKCQQCEIFEFLEPIVGNTSPRSAVETTGKPLHDEECENCGVPWSKHLTNKLICPDASIQDVYRFRQKGSAVEPRDPAKWCSCGKYLKTTTHACLSVEPSPELYTQEALDAAHQRTRERLATLKVDTDLPEKASGCTYPTCGCPGTERCRFIAGESP